MSSSKPRSDDRAYWLSVLERLARPVLGALARRELKATFAVEHAPGVSDREEYTYLEALGRLLAGIAPWLELGPDETPEGALREELGALAREAIAAGVDPESVDYLNFHNGQQAIVDAAFLAQALLRAPSQLWAKLAPEVQDQLAACLSATRDRKPGLSNWLLFSAMTEAALCKMGRENGRAYFWDPMRIDYAVRLHAQWYKGDGIYGDGPNFHWDYYNSFVIQPMLVDVLAAMDPDETGEYGMKYSVALQRTQRWAEVQERLISPEGTFPPLGRSLTYRFGALQSLAQAALLDNLPASVAPGQVRAAMTTVIRRMTEAPGTFDANGWLTIGFCGHQPSLGERYISTGSLYLCSAGLLPLGLPASDPFWSDPPQPWTSQKIWAGEDAPCDHARS